MKKKKTINCQFGRGQKSAPSHPGKRLLPPKTGDANRTDHVSKRGFLDRQYAGSPDETKSCVWEECSYFLVSFAMWV